MNKILSILGGLTITGVIAYFIKLFVKNYIKNNPVQVITLIFNVVGYLIVQFINLFEWMLNTLL